MTIIFRAKENPDGLDEIFEAYQTLKAVFEAAEVVEIDLGDGRVDVMLRLPGSGEMVDPNDANALNGLEHWLAERVARQVEE